MHLPFAHDSKCPLAHTVLRFSMHALSLRLGWIVLRTIAFEPRTTYSDFRESRETSSPRSCMRSTVVPCLPVQSVHPHGHLRGHAAPNGQFLACWHRWNTAAPDRET
jgi:hypothetical protein